MKKRNFTINSYALAGVIEALLIIALVVMVISTIQLYYVPQIMNERESDHMDEVINQMSSLKSIIEVQSMMGVLKGDQPISYTPMNSPLTLGSDQLPYFVSTKALGQINIFDKYEVTSKIVIDPKSPDFLSDIPLTAIRFRGDNAYFVDQEYILEGGGIVLKQQTGETMKVPPSINVENNTEDITLYYTIPLYVAPEGKDLTGGWDTKFIRTNYTRHYSHSDQSINHIYIYTEYLSAWNQSLRNNNKGSLWEYYDNGYISVDYDNPDNPTRIEITPGTKDIDIEFIIVEIGAQISPGFVV